MVSSLKSAASMNWDDLRVVAAVARHGSLLQAGAALGVDHTTVGRRLSGAEKSLGTKLFIRSTTGLVLTADGEQLLAPLTQVEDAILAVERRVRDDKTALTGSVTVTAPETFALAWLAKHLSLLAKQHPGLQVHLDPSGAVRNLNRREAEIAVRTVQSRDPSLAVRRGATIGYGLYAAKSLLARYPVRTSVDLRGKHLLTGLPNDQESAWLLDLAAGTAPSFTCVVAVGLVAAAKAGAGIAVLPRYLGDAEPELTYLPMPHEPKETLWVTVHRDLRKTPRVRLVLDFIADTLRREQTILAGG
jgi:DNA-binding transcriptional LysR family regulator